MAATPADDGGGPHDPLVPEEGAQELAELMIDAEDVMETVLDETVVSAEQGTIRESGRTACSNTDDIRPPIARYEEAVELAACPLGRTGIWHTHPTEFGLSDPVHSLPDWGNVVFHGVDASIVVGTQSSEVLVSATDQEAMAAAFKSAIGVEVSSTPELVDAVRSGEIAAPTSARRRVRQQLSPLVRRETTTFPDIEARISDLSIPAADAIHACGVVEEVEKHHSRGHEGVAHPHLTADDGRRSMGMHRRAYDAPRPSRAAEKATQGISVREVAIATIIGNVVGNLMDNLVFNK